MCLAMPFQSLSYLVFFPQDAGHMEGSVGVVALVGTLFDQTSCKIIRVAFLMPFFDFL